MPRKLPSYLRDINSSTRSHTLWSKLGRLPGGSYLKAVTGMGIRLIQGVGEAQKNGFWAEWQVCRCESTEHLWSRQRG